MMRVYGINENRREELEAGGKLGIETGKSI